ncbi:hypothetical protein [Pseudohongiella sp.]|nr:hypothetical protein [Pseudohongiella sp.]HDZ07742.1 hypothetical protein [Pseudohongiella sp.]
MILVTATFAVSVSYAAESRAALLESAVRKALGVDGDIASATFNIDPRHLRMSAYVSELAGINRKMKECLQLMHVEGKSLEALDACSVVNNFNTFMDRYGLSGMRGESEDLNAEENQSANELGLSTLGTVQVIQLLMEFRF